MTVIAERDEHHLGIRDDGQAALRVELVLADTGKDALAGAVLDVTGSPVAGGNLYSSRTAKTSTMSAYPLKCFSNFCHAVFRVFGGLSHIYRQFGRRVVIKRLLQEVSKS